MEEQKTKAGRLTTYLIDDGMIPLNKKLIHHLGANAAIFYGELVRKYDYFESRGELTDDGYFYNSSKNMEIDTGLSKNQQPDAIELLEEKGLIKQDTRVVENSPHPQKVRHFKIIFDYEQIDKVLNLGLKDKEKKAEKLAKSNEKSLKRLLDYANKGEEIHTTDNQHCTTLKNSNVQDLKSGVNKNKGNKNKTNKINKDSSFNLENPQNPADKVMKYYLDRVKQYFEPPKVNDKWKKLINSRLEDYGVDEIKSAIDAVASNDFYNGKEDQDFKATPKYIFNDENLTKWISNSKKFNSSIGDDIIPDYYADLD